MGYPVLLTIKPRGLSAIDLEFSGFLTLEPKEGAFFTVVHDDDYRLTFQKVSERLCHVGVQARGSEMTDEQKRMLIEEFKAAGWRHLDGPEEDRIDAHLEHIASLK